MNIKQVCLGGLVLMMLGGCDERSDDQQSAGNSDVVVDFYGHEGRSSACSGTLLAPKVVVTAAHCMEGSEGARVKTTGAKVARAEVEWMLSYDYAVGGAKAANGSAHDIAILVLRTPLAVSEYAHFSTASPRGKNVVMYGRKHGAHGVAGSRIVKSAAHRLSSAAQGGRPFAATMAEGLDDAGGAVRGPDGAIVGIVMGRGNSSRVGYVALVNKGFIVQWLRAAVATFGHGVPTKSATSKTPTPTLTTKSVDEADDTGVDDTGQDDFGDEVGDDVTGQDDTGQDDFGDDLSDDGGDLNDDAIVDGNDEGAVEGSNANGEDPNGEGAQDSTAADQNESEAPPEGSHAPQNMVERSDGSTTQYFDDGSTMTTQPDDTTDATPSNWPLGKRFADGDGAQYQFNPNLGRGIDRFDSDGNYQDTVSIEDVNTSNPTLARQMGYYYMNNITKALRVKEGTPITPGQ